MLDFKHLHGYEKSLATSNNMAVCLAFKVSWTLRRRFVVGFLWASRTVLRHSVIENQIQRTHQVPDRQQWRVHSTVLRNWHSIGTFEHKMENVNTKKRMGFDVKKKTRRSTHTHTHLVEEQSGGEGGESNSLYRNSFETPKHNGKVTRPSSHKGRGTVDEPSATCAMAQHISRSVQSSEQKPDDRIWWLPNGWNILVSPPLGISALNWLDYCLCVCKRYLCKVWHFQDGCLWEGPPCGLVASYERLEGIHGLHLREEDATLRTEAVGSSKIFFFFFCIHLDLFVSFHHLHI